MAIRNARPAKWVPLGVSDTLDGTETPPGAMAALANLIPDQTTRGIWVCRPASALQTSFATFNTPVFVSAILVIGSRVYGMVATARNAGKDEPFCYDIVASAFVAISTVTNANTPTSPATTGAWTPPRMALVGSRIVVCHPGFNGAPNKVGFIDISVLATPAWSAGDTAPQVLAGVPVDVINFNGRAYYAVNTPTSAAVQFSDILVPGTITNATQVVTMDNVVPITALGGIPLNSPIQGGSTQAIVIFQGVTQMYQITGDSALNNLLRNKLSFPTGTLAANSVFSTPNGLAFVSPEGLRMCDQAGNVSDPIGVDGQGVAVPFQYSVVPSRMAGACNGHTIRLSVQNGYTSLQPSQEYWYDMARKQWSGPHSFAASLIAPYAATFAKTPIGVTGKLFTSDYFQTLSSGFVENSVQMTWSYSTALLPDNDDMSEHSINEATIDMAYPQGIPAFLGTAFNQDGTLYDSVSLSPGGSSTFWGGFVWGTGIWFGTSTALVARPLNWHQGLTYRRIGFGFSGQSASSFKIGTLRLRVETLAYLQQTSSS